VAADAVAKKGSHPSDALVCKKNPRYAVAGGTGRKQLYLYEPGDPLSAVWAQLTLQQRHRPALMEAERKLKQLARESCADCG
jgi:hypothetical protein